MNTLNEPASSPTRDRRPWEPPTVKTVGTIGEVLQQGVGKTSKVGGDPGESRKMGGSMG
jgi:hypothetical protein